MQGKCMAYAAKVCFTLNASEAEQRCFHKLHVIISTCFQHLLPGGSMLGTQFCEISPATCLALFLHALLHV